MLMDSGIFPVRAHHDRATSASIEITHEIGRAGATIRVVGTDIFLRQVPPVDARFAHRALTISRRGPMARSSLPGEPWVNEATFSTAERSGRAAVSSQAPMGSSARWS